MYDSGGAALHRSFQQFEMDVFRARAVSAVFSQCHQIARAVLVDPTRVFQLFDYYLQ